MSLSPLELREGPPNAATRGLLSAIAIGAALLVAALTAAPARADEVGGIGTPAAIVNSPLASDTSNAGGGAIAPSANPAGTNSAADNGQPTSTAQDNTATNTQTTTTTGGNGGTATGGNSGPSQVVGNGSVGGSHGGSASANGGHAESHSSVQNQQSNQTFGRDSWGTRHSGDRGNSWGGRDSFVVEKNTKPRHAGSPSAGAYHARFPALFGLTAPSRAIPFEASERHGHETAKASPLGGRLPGHGGWLPGQNPFFNLLSGSGGGGAGVILLLLAVLGASIALPTQRSKAFRTRTVVWRPLAYVPPIELPG